MHITKMHGIGNDYIYLNGLDGVEEDLSGLAIRLSDRHFGVGGDGLICIRPGRGGDFSMEMYNADGSRGAMCGNGIRCVGKYVYDKGLTRKTCLTIDTDAGPRVLELRVRGDGWSRSRWTWGSLCCPLRCLWKRKEIPIRYGLWIWATRMVWYSAPHWSRFLWSGSARFWRKTGHFPRESTWSLRWPGVRNGWMSGCGSGERDYPSLRNGGLCGAGGSGQDWTVRTAGCGAASRGHAGTGLGSEQRAHLDDWSGGDCIRGGG